MYDFDRCVHALNSLDRARSEGLAEPTASLKRSLHPHEIDALLPSIGADALPLGCSQTQCPICIQDYVKWDYLRIFKPCRHKFHRSCLDEWLTSWTYGPTCPVCRVPLVQTEETDRS
jgi:hypothetical protein